MGFKKLEAHLAKQSAEKAVKDKLRKDKEFRVAVRKALPKKFGAAPRPRGRPAKNGVSPKEVKHLAEQVESYLSTEDGMERLEMDVKRTALLVMLIDGLLGTQPWRAAPMLAAASRVRFVENAIRLLEDLKQQSGGDAKKLVGEIIEVTVK